MNPCCLCPTRPTQAGIGPGRDAGTLAEAAYSPEVLTWSHCSVYVQELRFHPWELAFLHAGPGQVPDRLFGCFVAVCGHPLQVPIRDMACSATTSLRQGCRHAEVSPAANSPHRFLP